MELERAHIEYNGRFMFASLKPEEEFLFFNSYHARFARLIIFSVSRVSSEFGKKKNFGIIYKVNFISAVARTTARAVQSVQHRGFTPVIIIIRTITMYSPQEWLRM